MSEQRYVVCYDIPNDKRRLKISKLLDSYGDRVQFSIFEAVLTAPLFDKLIREITDLIIPDEDQVTVYALCGSCEKRRMDLGIKLPVLPGNEDVFIV